MEAFLITDAARSYSRFKSKTILESLTCRCRAAAREELAGALEIFRRIDAERHAVDDLDIDAHTGFERAQLLELLAQLQRRGRQRYKPLQRVPAISIEPDMVIKRALAPGR